MDEKLIATIEEFTKAQEELGQVLSHDLCKSCVQEIQGIARSKLKPFKIEHQHMLDLSLSLSLQESCLSLFLM